MENSIVLLIWLIQCTNADVSSIKRSTKLLQCLSSFRDPARDPSKPQKESILFPIRGIRRQDFSPTAFPFLQLLLPILPIVPSISPLMVAMALFPQTIVHVSLADWPILQVASVVGC